MRLRTVLTKRSKCLASHKSLKWYQAVYHRICKIALTNGHILRKRDKGDSCLDAAKFWKQVVDGLLAEYIPSASIPRGKPSGKPLPNRLLSPVNLTAMTVCKFTATVSQLLVLEVYQLE